MEENGEGCNIELFPDDILLNVFCYLSIEDLARVAVVCKTWYRVALDDYLWRDVFHRDAKLQRSLPIAPGKRFWKSEYKRIKYHIPARQSQEITDHKDQVLHVSFSHNGLLFATCSKDGTFKVWTSEHPCKLKFKHDMKEFHWKYTQFSQFNLSDSLLLVSGVHFGESSTSGEIAVFSIHDNFELQCRMINKPYDVFGTWYNDTHLLSGSLYWTGQLNSCSALWLNMVLASQAIETEDESVVMRLFKFHNQNGSSIRTIMIANCYSEQQLFYLRERKQSFQHMVSCAVCKKKYLAKISDDIDSEGFTDIDYPDHHNLSKPKSEISSSSGNTTERFLSLTDLELNGTIEYATEYHQAEQGMQVQSTSVTAEEKCNGIPTSEDLSMIEQSSSSNNVVYDTKGCSSFDSRTNIDNENGAHAKKISADAQTTCENGGYFESKLNEIEGYLQLCDKLLIFTLGSSTYTPHQIGIKRIPMSGTNNNLNETNLRGNRLLPSVSDNHQGLEKTYDKVDHIFEMGGHIIGMCLSPDQRFLYVNCRPWPRNYRIERPEEPPPLAQEIDIHVIDLQRMKEVGTMLKSHKAYTANDECFFIFLDVSNEYVASGAEDKHGYLWDRHYGTCLNKFPHQNVVNCVAFNPADPEMLVTVSDDYHIKVWRSHNWFHQQQQLHPQNEPEQETGRHNKETENQSDDQIQ